MGKLIKNHLARLIIMTAAMCKASSLFPYHDYLPVDTDFALQP
jgi:hypothetical protein